jgi:hypothetical protein
MQKSEANIAKSLSMFFSIIAEKSTVKGALIEKLTI